MDDLYVNFTVAISKLNKLIQKIKSIEIGKYGLQAIHVSCIYYLSKNAEGLTAKEISALSLEDKAAISRALKTLQERGYVEYSPGGRNEKVKLTSSGREFSKIISKKTNSAVVAGSAHINTTQRKFLYDSLLEISNNLIYYYQNLLDKKEALDDKKTKDSI